MAEGEGRNSSGGRRWFGLLLGTIFRTAEDFVEFAEGYFELTLPLEVVAQVYEGAAITKEMIKALNPDGDVETILQELAELDT